MEDKNAEEGEFKKNEARECSNYFGRKPANELLKKNKLLSILRGH